MVKVIHEELILLLVLDFDDVFDLHQGWSVSTAVEIKDGVSLL